MRVANQIFGILIFFFTVSLYSQNNKDKIKVVPLPRSINTQFNEFGPSITGDGKTLYFYSKRNSKTNTDIFQTTFENGQWSFPQEVIELNSEYDDQSPYVDPSGRFMVFSSNRDGSIEFRIPQGIGVSRDLYYSEKVNGRWSRPALLPFSINTADMEENPYVFGEYVYFTRYPFGQKEKAKIYRAKLSSRDVYPAEELPSHINMPGTATITAVVSPDGQYLYFASNRSGGYGGFDIYKSKINKDGSFGEPENLGPDINTQSDEAYMIVSYQQNTIFFCRRNMDANSDYDIYTAKLPDDSDPRAKPIPPLPPKGKPGNIEPKNELVAKTEPKTPAKLPTKSKLNKIETDTFPPIKKKPEINIAKILKEKKKLTLNNINFDINSSDLRPESFPILNTIIDFLKDNPDQRIKIIGHTDLTGDLEFNQQLSWYRAESVKKYFVSKGIDKMRILTDGKGSSQPVINNKEPESNQINRRTEFEVLDPAK
ncbi:MAG: PD40 domain-containing protein [Leptospiraceae bacterium]|nr:PD40 domain-containing protein [Leptospiraceae bacterium]